MAEVGTLVQYVSVLIISEIGLKVHAACNPPPPVSGTRHNGMLAVYQTGDVLSFTCDTGYNPNYNPPTSTCLDSGAWNPPEVACELDVGSLVVAVGTAISACMIFAAIVAFFLRTRRCRRRHRNTSSTKSPKVKRRSPKSPEYPPETFEMSRPQSFYDSMQIGGNTGQRSQPNDYYNTLIGLSGIREQGDETSGGLQNPGRVDDEGVHIVDAGGLKVTGAGSSRSPDYENSEIMGKELGVSSYENTSVLKNIAAGSSQSPDYENAENIGKEIDVTSHCYENTAIPNNSKLFH